MSALTKPLRSLREQVSALHAELVRYGLVVWTAGNVSGRVPGYDLMVIKPSGVSYDELTPESMIVCDLDGVGLSERVGGAEVLVSTIPADVAARYAERFAAIPVLLDAVYNPWPTPLAAAVAATGGRVISGLQMLLHQAFAQVEQFTGLPAPREAMTCAADALD